MLNKVFPLLCIISLFHLPQNTSKINPNLPFQVKLSAHIILDPASLFEVPFPILNSLLIHFGSSNQSAIALTHKTGIPACLSSGFLQKGLAPQIDGSDFHVVQNIWLFSFAKSPSM